MYTISIKNSLQNSIATASQESYKKNGETPPVFA